MANTPMKVEVTVADMPQIQELFRLMAELSIAVKAMPTEELERLPTPILKPLGALLMKAGTIDHTKLTSQEGALKQKIGNLITGAGAGTVEVSDLRRALEER